MQLVDFRRQLHYRGVLYFSYLEVIYEQHTKSIENKHICEQATPNLGITQSSGLDHLSGYPDK